MSESKPIYYIHGMKAIGPEFTYRYMVYAFDPNDGCGFTPQDWNWTWIPDEKYKRVTKIEFKQIISKIGLKSVTTHFPFEYYKFYIKNK